ncbi:non-reducing polyketide synthase [Talaromyces proteolyticus]|uniref:Non-reducing polyketide synthase n=1 Tax=Talaromyces proteolyticus TaxID=1131652 RepID=A0AAD4L1W9_9EURO|nr:non-reducing polyketide synthase [Talaromyces proteolyticus]KAH8706037.1 non-reducing polyketide synthase [Talaromyces proteolyticus]
MKTQTGKTKLVFLFGDQVDSWHNGLDHVYKVAGSTPWLQSYLDDLSKAMSTEIRIATLDPALQASVGAFSSLQELGERYRHTSDDLGMAQCLLLHAVRSSLLLQMVKQQPHILWPESTNEWLGISGGLLSLSSWVISEDFDTLREASLEVGRLFVRLCKLVSVRSRAVEDNTGVWGWAVVGISKDDLRKILGQFQQSMGIPTVKQARVGVTGAGWSTVIGPPSVLELCIKQCPTLKNATKNPLNIHALQHTLTITRADLDYIIGGNSRLTERTLCQSGPHIWGMDDPGAEYQNWGEMLRAVCLQVLSLPLDIPEAVAKLNATLKGYDSVRVVQMDNTSHGPFMANALKASGCKVTITEAHAYLQEKIQDSPQPQLSGRIAIVGMSGRGPRSDNIDEFWDVIMNKQDTCTEVPKDRFDIEEFYCEEHGRGNKGCTMTTRYGCFMDKPGHFDARFFHISPREAMLMDPGHRHFLMSSYEALEMAGYSNGRTKSTDPNRIAAFYGQVTDDWHDQSHPTIGCDAYTLQGVQRAFSSGRLAWQFKWEGPTYSIDSACASTTTAIHLACMSLLSNDIDMAVAGASNILNYPHSFACLSKSGVLSDTGNCKPYRDDADGYCRADFVGSIVLKRLEDAVAENDNILAVIASSGRNHSGNSTSITSSDPGAQERLFRKILRNANVSPDDISYVEMHGTGTPVGDPAEMSAVGNVFKHRRRADGPLPVGAVKANFGHSEGAAGMASLLKCIMMFKTDTIPPQAGMPHALNPNFPPLSELNIEIPAEPKEFKKKPGSGEPRRILLNNFDAAGGNACLLLEEWEDGRTAVMEEQHVADPRSSYVVAVSSRTHAAHKANRRNFLEWLRANTTLRLADIAYTTTARRMHHSIRSAYTASTVQELVSKLEASIQGPDSESSSSSSHTPIVFVFTGQGAHYSGMGKELYHTSPTFRETVDLCARICEEYGFPTFIDIITDEKSVDNPSQSTLRTHLAVLTLEIGLAAFWKAAGIQPSMVIGHSLGEYAGLYVAGVLSLADVLYLVGRRATLLLERCETDTFSMLAIAMSAKDAQQLLESTTDFSSCRISCVNSPTSIVISGTTHDITKLKSSVTITSKILPVPYGFHSFQMDSVVSEYSTLAEGVTFFEPKIPVASTLLGSVVETSGTFSSGYLAQQTRQPVDFIGGLNAIKERIADPVWLELGPSQVCTSFVRATVFPSSPVARTISTLDGPNRDWVSISKCMASLYTLGIDIDWLALHAPFTGSLKMLTTPAYAWDTKNFWITYAEAQSVQAGAPPTAKGSKEPVISTFAQEVAHESSMASGQIEVTFRASLADESLWAVIQGHRMEQMAICPGSAFCEAAFAAASYVLKSRGRKEDASVTRLGLRNPAMRRPLTKNLVGSGGELLTTVTMKNKDSNDINISWKAATSGKNSPMFELGTCSLVVCENIETLQTSWDRISYLIKDRMDGIIKAAKDGDGHRLKHDIFYSLFAQTVQYDPLYKCIKEAYVSGDFCEAVAEVVLQENPAGAKFMASPYWGEGIIHLAGFTANANHTRSPNTSFINSGFESFEQTVEFEAGMSYFTYVRVHRKEQGNRVYQVFVFDSQSKLVAQCCNLNFVEISNSVLQHNLSGGAVQSTNQHNGRNTSHDTYNKAPEREQTASLAPTSVKVEQLSKANLIQSDAAPGLFEVLVDTIVSETGIDASELTDDTMVAELGVDSIMSIEIANKISNATGQPMTPMFLQEYPTIGDLRRAYEVLPPATPESGAESTEYDLIEDIMSEESTQLQNQAEDSSAVEIIDMPTTKKTVTIQQQSIVDDGSTEPTVRFTLLHGYGTKRSKGKQVSSAPFYLLADGTGSIATYLHLPPHIKTKMAIYGVDSPYLQCPSRLTPEIGIPGVAKLIVDALVKRQPKGVPFWLGGFSGGAMIAYEVSRQLSAAGHIVDSLLLIDMCPPRQIKPQGYDDELGLAMFNAISGRDDSGVWDSSDKTNQHLRALFASVGAYNPSPLANGENPPAKRTALIWAQKGMIDRCSNSPQFNKILADHGVVTTAYPRFMEDPKLGAVAWSLIHKTEADLGSNGWDKFVGNDRLLCMAVEADHLELPTPDFVHLLGEAMDKAFEYFKQ